MLGLVTGALKEHSELMKKNLNRYKAPMSKKRAGWMYTQLYAMLLQLKEAPIRDEHTEAKLMLLNYSLSGQPIYDRETAAQWYDGRKI